jgi:hypothetical protein
MAKKHKHKSSEKTPFYTQKAFWLSILLILCGASLAKMMSREKSFNSTVFHILNNIDPEVSNCNKPLNTFYGINAFGKGEFLGEYDQKKFERNAVICDSQVRENRRKNDDFIQKDMPLFLKGVLQDLSKNAPNCLSQESLMFANSYSHLKVGERFFKGSVGNCGEFARVPLAMLRENQALSENDLGELSLEGGGEGHAMGVIFPENSSGYQSSKNTQDFTSLSDMAMRHPDAIFFDYWNNMHFEGALILDQDKFREQIKQNLKRAHPDKYDEKTLDSYAGKIMTYYKQFNKVQCRIYPSSVSVTHEENLLKCQKKIAEFVQARTRKIK